ncbi:MAG: hypothetical protein V3V74_00480 [Nitrosomonadaceae bacterium]
MTGTNIVICYWREYCDMPPNVLVHSHKAIAISMAAMCRLQKLVISKRRSANEKSDLQIQSDYFGLAPFPDLERPQQRLP